MSKRSVRIDVDELKLLPPEDLEIIQGELKDLPVASYNHLRGEIDELGFSFAIHAWPNPETKKLEVLDGTQRLRTILKMREEGFDCPKVPVVIVRAKSRKEAARKLLGGAGAYGKPTGQGLYAFMHAFGIEPIELERIELPGIVVPNFRAEFFEEPVVGNTDDDAVPGPPKIARTKRGELWTLGDHRLLCGDSTSREDVERLMGGERAIAAITDPPYSVGYENQERKPGTRTRKEKGDAYEDPVSALELLTGLFSCLPSDVLVMSYPFDRHFESLFAASRGWDLLYECVWVKHHFAFCIGKRYQQQHEPILIFRRKKGVSKFNVPNNQSTVFEYDKAAKNPDHPTPKPVDLFSKLVEYQSDRSDIVFEPFGGSGTTLIACHKTGRRCFGVELEPTYVDVILDRWAAFTSKDPVREDGKCWSEIKAGLPQKNVKN